MFKRILSLYRSVTAVPGSFLTDGTPTVPICDNAGIIWTRLSTGAGGLGISGGTVVSDNVVAAGINGLDARSFLYGFDGTNFDLLRTVSATLAGTQPKVGVIAVERSGDWAITHDPAANVQATITRAAIAGSRHVCTSLTATLSGAANAGLPTIFLRDGAAGVGAILWSATLTIALGLSASITLSNLSIVGTTGNAMTFEFAIASGAGSKENVSLTGYDVA